MRSRTTSVKSHPVEAVPADGTNVLFDVWLASRAVTGMLDVALAPTGLTADEFGVYSVLTTTDSMTPSELAVWMSAPTTTVSSYVKRLEQRGHLERHRNPADGRSFVLRLTPSGRAAHKAAGKAFLPVLRGVSASLGADQHHVRRALTSLRAAVEDCTSATR